MLDHIGFNVLPVAVDLRCPPLVHELDVGMTGMRRIADRQLLADRGPAAYGHDLVKAYVRITA